MHYLITGGAGYIGSHMAALLHEQGHRITILDNFSNSTHAALSRLQNLCNNEIHFMQVDVCDKALLDAAFKTASLRVPIDGVLHFAGLKAVGESNEQPLRYYQNNVSGTLALCEIMEKHRIFSLVFSSSATVYGTPEVLPVNENCRTNTINPYGSSKLMCENILTDLSHSSSKWHISLLRYFNPAGAHPSGEIGEEPNGVPNNLLPYVFDVASGLREHVNVFGDDYDTKDGTGVRDYIHVMDLVEGHAAALNYLDKNPGVHTFNLGCGKGYSVFDIVNAIRTHTNASIPIKLAPRRKGDLGTVYADPKKASALLEWKAVRDLDTMISDQWRWQQNRSQINSGEIEHVDKIA